MRKRKLGGVMLPHLKTTEDITPQSFNTPREVTLPMKMHIGKAATVSVGVGEYVGVGDIVGKADGIFSANVHASVSGRVKEILQVRLPDGSVCQGVEILSDGEHRLSGKLKVPKVSTVREFIDALFASGIVGLGGAGFPTHIKYDVGQRKFDTLIINSAECEPYITSDTHMARDCLEDVSFAIRTVCSLYGDINVIIACEKKNFMERWCREICGHVGCTLKVLSTRYPQGAEKVLIYNTVGRTVPLGALPIDAGCIVSNLSTVAEIGKYLRTGVPLVRKLVTVDGDAVLCPTVADIPIGTSVSELLEWCGGCKSKAGKILFGGPMMGVAIENTAMPILKNVNAITVFSKKSAYLPHSDMCIRCGSCLRNCPVSIDSAAVGRAVKIGDYRTAKRLGIEACIECGCCSFVCPAKISLTENNKRIKKELRAMNSSSI
ncbi:MAG: RnfABCDGE type electron transport complex subunit C [Clostridia bacterium]|nr:RnfABCDGE type electron transport complex subunit C [Clostridia bacterium]